MAMFDAWYLYGYLCGHVKKAYNDMRKRGKLQAGTGSYYDAYGKNLNEQNWVNHSQSEYGKE